MTGLTDLMTDLNYSPAVEDPAPARRWLSSHGNRLGAFVDGRFAPPGADLPVITALDGAMIAHATETTVEEGLRALRVARRAGKRWAALAPWERTDHLLSFARRVEENRTLLTLLSVLETGRPITRVQEEIAALPGRLRAAATAPSDAPLGVGLMLLSADTGLGDIAHDLAAALAAGNALVLKPAPKTPLTALALAAIAAEGGLPRGLLNVVSGGAPLGTALAQSEIPGRIVLFGSEEAGRSLLRETAGLHKSLALRLGGTPVFIVFGDADPDAAIEAIVAGFGRHGARVLIAADMAARFETLLLRRFERLRTGNPLARGNDLGALRSAATARLAHLLSTASAEGLEIVRGRAAEGGVAPELIRAVSPASALWDASIPGPVAITATFRSVEEAVALANNSRFAAPVSVWSGSGGRALQLTLQLRSGSIAVNAPVEASAPPRGDSGFGGWSLADWSRPEVPSRGRPERASAPPQAIPVNSGARLVIGGVARSPAGGEGYAAEAGVAPLGSAKDVAAAIESAQKASAWSRLPPAERARILHLGAERFSREAGRIAGTTAREALGPAIDRFRNATLPLGTGESQIGAERLMLRQPDPFGIVTLACPADAPLMAPLSLLLPLLARGNRVVMLPSPRDPQPAIGLALLLSAAGLPPGTVSVVSGNRDALLPPLAGHDAVDAVWCFGTSELAKVAEETASLSLKPVLARDGGRIEWSSREMEGGWLLHAARRERCISLPTRP
ncbi:MULTISPECIES: aldehyde dehydrogenase family protein [unclassified Haematobacter]|uniref:aldehyde dehydrogenase family protein n=1 Tax=unclassified Haematobacter TaxID=2640585 RepID=UPI0025BE21B0|nr:MULTISPECIES: aldehyde dehydrogenase family protein [unclassified Haematobacter]